MVCDFVVFISIDAPSESVTVAVNPPVIVIGGRAMIKAVAVAVLSCTPEPQFKVTVVADASVRLTAGVVAAETDTTAAPQSISLLFPDIDIEEIVAVPLSWSFTPPSTFLNLRL